MFDTEEFGSEMGEFDDPRKTSDFLPSLPTGSLMWRSLSCRYTSDTPKRRLADKLPTGVVAPHLTAF